MNTNVARSSAAGCIHPWMSGPTHKTFMDPITHTCSGILLGQRLRPLTAVRKTTLVVAGLAAFAPVAAVNELASLERTLSQRAPDVMLLDLEMPGLDVPPWPSSAVATAVKAPSSSHVSDVAAA